MPGRVGAGKVWAGSAQSKQPADQTVLFSHCNMLAEFPLNKLLRWSFGEEEEKKEVSTSFCIIVEFVSKLTGIK